MNWYEEDVKQLEKLSLTAGHDPDIIFYGSSSIRMWDSLKEDFPGREVLNLGFGGSTLAACVWFFERIMSGYRPKVLVVYAGDNDLGDGRNPEEVFIFFQQLMVKVHQQFGDLPCYFVSLKPSVGRWHLADQFEYTNKLIAEEITKTEAKWTFIDVYHQMLDSSGSPAAGLYAADGLHLSKQGYQLWKEIINDALA